MFEISLLCNIAMEKIHPCLIIPFWVIHSYYQCITITHPEWMPTNEFRSYLMSFQTIWANQRNYVTVLSSLRNMGRLHLLKRSKRRLTRLLRGTNSQCTFCLSVQNSTRVFLSPENATSRRACTGKLSPLTYILYMHTTQWRLQIWGYDMNEPTRGKIHCALGHTYNKFTPAYLCRPVSHSSHMRFALSNAPHWCAQRTPGSFIFLTSL
jgi:hypothetical protein